MLVAVFKHPKPTTQIIDSGDKGWFYRFSWGLNVDCWATDNIVRPAKLEEFDLDATGGQISSGLLQLFSRVKHFQTRGNRDKYLFIICLSSNEPYLQ